MFEHVRDDCLVEYENEFHNKICQFRDNFKGVEIEDFFDGVDPATQDFKLCDVLTPLHT